MSVDRSLIFGEEAEAYDRARPRYPQSLIEEALSRARAHVALEIGAGTGKATAAFARPGLRIVCLEPSPEMARVLAGRSLPGVEILITTFEDYRPGIGSFDLIYAAQAWHWVDRSRAYGRARGLLRPGGVLALLWNVPDDRYRDFADVYREYAPEILAEHDQRVQRRDSRVWRDELVAAGFTGAYLVEEAWSQQLTAAELRALYGTYSDHMMVPEPSRSALLDGLEQAVSERGGSMTLEYVTRLFIGINPAR